MNTQGNCLCVKSKSDIMALIFTKRHAIRIFVHVRWLLKYNLGRVHEQARHVCRLLFYFTMYFGSPNKKFQNNQKSNRNFHREQKSDFDRFLMTDALNRPGWHPQINEFIWAVLGILWWYSRAWLRLYSSFR